MRTGTRLAALDLGSNSFRLEIGKYEHGQIHRVEYLKETVRQGNGLDENNNLSLEAMQRGWDCLARFSERLAGFKREHIRAVATQTLREANNRDIFLAKAYDILGFPIDVIAGREEARLIYTGVANLLPQNDERRLVVDIGGRSTELILGRNLEPQTLESFQLGSVTWSMRHFPDNKYSTALFNRAHTAAMAVLEEALDSYPRTRWDVALGSSGTIGAIADILAAQGGTPGLIQRDALLQLRQRVIKMRTPSGLDFPTLKDDRRPVLAGGLAVLIAVFETLNIEEMQVAQGALRQGVLYDLLKREQPATDLRTITVGRLMDKFGVDHKQAQRVEETALTLFRHTKPIAGRALQRERTERKLRWCARLHEIGMHISHSSYHRHGAYILDNAEAPGFALPELHNLSVIVLGQRGKLRKLELDYDNIGLVTQLMAMRLAVILCHARRMPKLEGVTLTRHLNPLSFTLSLPASWEEVLPQSVFLLQQEADAWEKTPVQLQLKLV